MMSNFLWGVGIAFGVATVIVLVRMIQAVRRFIKDTREL